MLFRLLVLLVLVQVSVGNVGAQTDTTRTEIENVLDAIDGFVKALDTLRTVPDSVSAVKWLFPAVDVLLGMYQWRGYEMFLRTPKNTRGMLWALQNSTGVAIQLQGYSSLAKGLLVTADLPIYVRDRLVHFDVMTTRLALFIQTKEE